MLRIHKAKINNESEVVIWGTGSPRREFLYIDDLAESLFVLMNEYNSNEIINIGCGYDISIKDLATLISKIVGFKGKLVFDNSKPDGTPQKLLDTSKINSLGWKSKTNLENGLFITYEWLTNNYENIKI